jgi:hypothetical protein
MTMARPPIRALLEESESSTLDFKGGQYRFDKASDSDKAELLGDILAFANAWRRTDAYTLISVEETLQGKGRVVGVSEHLRDASIQQFVNSKTNRAVEFSYQAVEWLGVELGVLTIPAQQRPLYLLKSDGGLKANTVYVRRNSSTAEADPDETARMGAESATAASPVPRIEFADLPRRQVLGADVTVAIEVLLPTDELLAPERHSRHGFMEFSQPALVREPSRAELAEYVAERSLWAGVGFAVANLADTLAKKSLQAQAPDRVRP